MLRVGVIGAAGRMGAASCAAVEEADDLELVARVGKDDPLDLLVEAKAQVAVEFTTPDSVGANARFCVEHRINTVIGATGLGEDDVAALDEGAKANAVGVFIAPNFALGAVLMMRFATEAARYFEWAEIVERHHEKKLDAPSGTSLRTAALMNEARSGAWGGAEGRGSSAARGEDSAGVRIHSLRVPGSVAHQEVVFGAPGETLTIRHDSLERSSFMPGVLLAIRKVSGLRGVTVGLEELLDA